MLKFVIGAVALLGLSAVGVAFYAHDGGCPFHCCGQSDEVQPTAVPDQDPPCCSQGQKIKLDCCKDTNDDSDSAYSGGFEFDAVPEKK
jgi:hypothetical protein